MDTSLIEMPARRSRRRHSAEFKQRIVEACQQPGVSISAVSLANGLNHNMVRNWIIAAERGAKSLRAPAEQGDGPRSSSDAPTPPPAIGFIPLGAIRAESCAITIEINRGTTAIKVSWPSSSAADCATWMRELLR